ncbi:MAG TPA: ATP-binding protein [Bacilli bacterium]|nr:ATP-binding protein [Bacilli bacterium]
MSVRRKLFVSMASFILVMTLLFVLVTQVVVKASLAYMDWADRSQEIGLLEETFQAFYERNGNSWSGVRQVQIGEDWQGERRDASFRLLSPDGDELFAVGDASWFSAEETAVDGALIRRLGIREDLKVAGETVAVLYYLDPEVANVSKLRIGISSSVAFLLLASALVFALVSLLVANWLSKRLTAPLRQLIPAIDRLGKGAFGVTAPITSKDEYGTVADAFNKMSAQLEHAESVRKNLVADVAHELRTPLTILRGHLELIQQSGRSIEPESLLPLQDELIRVSRLVDDLHQLSLAEAGKLPLERRLTDLIGLLKRILERVELDAADKSITLVMMRDDEFFVIDASEPLGTDASEPLGIDASMPIMVEIDPYRMTQVFLNLLVNAVRYTPTGGTVTVTVSVERDEVSEEAPSRLRVKIADTGPGIAPEHLPFLFERFYRTEEARTRNSGGMGLGLAIAKQFVLAHEGTIEVESSLGQGTVFIVELPASSR